MISKVMIEGPDAGLENSSLLFNEESWIISKFQVDLVKKKTFDVFQTKIYILCGGRRVFLFKEMDVWSTGIIISELVSIESKSLFG